MLFTRCPDCKTTFRITADALSKAGGQVRCGRCACVFDAHAELRERQADRTAETGAQPVAVSKEPPAAAETPSARTHAGGSPKDAPSDAHTSAAAPARTATSVDPAAGTADDAFDGVTVADVVAGIESVAVDKDEAAGDTASAERVAGGEPRARRATEDAARSPPTETGPPDWRLLPEPGGSARASIGWLAASIVAALALGVQVTHFFRAEIAGAAVVGPLLQNAYALIGAEVAPRWDVEQYRIVDWVATAEPDANGRGSLKITARIENRGPRSQPYPHVHVQLMDRWDSAVESRAFGPEVYLPNRGQADRLMAPGATTRAELDVVDPGPDAYGFELDVCVESGAQRLRCRADAVFPSM